MLTGYATRNGYDFAERFPPAAAAVAALPVRSCVIDGEANRLRRRGLAVFELLRHHAVAFRWCSALSIFWTDSFVPFGSPKEAGTCPWF